MAVNATVTHRPDLNGWQVVFADMDTGFMTDAEPTRAEIADLYRVAQGQVALRHQAATDTVLSAPPTVVGQRDTFAAGLVAAAGLIRHFAGRFPKTPDSARWVAAFDVLATEVEAVQRHDCALAGRFDLSAASAVSIASMGTADAA